jgi:hypothetical protein
MKMFLVEVGWGLGWGWGWGRWRWREEVYMLVSKGLLAIG